MATTVEHHASDERGLGTAGVIAVIILALLIAFFLFRWTGGAAGSASGPEPSVNVSGSLEGSY